MSAAAEVPGAARRLHPATVLLWVLRHGPSTLLGIPAIVAATSARGLFVIALLVAAGAGVLLLVTWLQWRAFSYAVEADALVIADGVFTRSRRSIPLERIQDVSVEQKPLARLLGLATVKIETGGGEKDEARLDSVGLGEAARLRGLLRGGGGVAIGDAADGDTPELPAERLVYRMTPSRVFHLGLYRFSLVWIAAVFAGLQMFDDVIGFDYDDLAAAAGIAGREALDLLSVGVVLAAGAAALLVGVASGLARTALTQWGFRLSLAEGRFRRTRGLLTRSEVVVAVRRIQLARVRRGWLSGRFGWGALEFQTLGGSDDAGGRQEMAPFARDPEIAPLLAAAGLDRFDPQPLRPVAAGHVVRAIVTRATLPLLLVLGGSLLFPPLLFALALLPLPVGTALLARRFHRYAIVGDSLQVARGVLARQEWVVPLDSVQAVSVSRTWLQRRLGVATVHVGTAGARGLARPDVVDVCVDDAAALTRRLVVRG